MQITRHEDSDTKIKLTIVATPTELTASKQKALKLLAPSVKLPGFRPGHVPANLIEKNLDPNHLQQEVINQALSLLYPKAVITENLRPVNDPSINLVKFVPYTTLEFTAEFEIVGKVELPSYSNLKVKKPDTKVEPKRSS